MMLFLAIILVILLLGILLLLHVFREHLQFGILRNERIYQDTEKTPGEILYARTIPLIGKPDYLIKHNNTIIPIEVKTGKTPKSPYANHIMQMMAYCYLVEEQYGIKPPGGYIHYPNREFHIAYTHEARESVKKLVRELMYYKKTNTEFSCTHPEHNIKSF